MAYHGGAIAGSSTHSLVVANICPGSTETIPMLASEHYLVLE